MDREEYSKNIRFKDRNTSWLRYGKSSIQGLSKSLADIGDQKHPPSCLINFMLNIKMDTV